MLMQSANISFERQGQKPLPPWQASSLLPTQVGALSKGDDKQGKRAEREQSPWSLEETALAPAFLRLAEASELAGHEGRSSQTQPLFFTQRQPWPLIRALTPLFRQTPCSVCSGLAACAGAENRLSIAATLKVPRN